MKQGQGRLALAAVAIAVSAPLGVSGCSWALPKNFVTDLLAEGRPAPIVGEKPRDATEVASHQTDVPKPPVGSEAPGSGIPKPPFPAERVPRTSIAVPGLPAPLAPDEEVELETTLIPLPVIATNPNEGVTLGFLPVFLFQDHGKINSFVAPQVNYNELFGLTTSISAQRFFSGGERVIAYAGISSEENQDFELDYVRPAVRSPIFSLSGRIGFLNDISYRYFGLGNDTKARDEASYTHNEFYLGGSVTVNCPLHFKVTLSELWRHVTVREGRIADLPSADRLHVKDAGMHPRTNGLYAHRIALIYDDRDDVDIPTRGSYGMIFYEITDAGLGSTSSYNAAGGEFRTYFSLADGRLITALRALGDWNSGENIPFWMRPSLGGQHSFRGFGQGRFVDNHRVVLQGEERIRIWDFTLFKAHCIVEPAVFAEVGRVLARKEVLKIEDWHLVVGGAIRLVVPESDLVAKIDVGFGEDGMAAFVGLGYPY